MEAHEPFLASATEVFPGEDGDRCGPHPSQVLFSNPLSVQLDESLQLLGNEAPL